jgi:hypothetical protein
MVAFALFLTSARSEPVGAKKHPILPCNNCTLLLPYGVFSSFCKVFLLVEGDSSCIAKRQLVTRSKSTRQSRAFQGQKQLPYANRNCCCLDCGETHATKWRAFPWTCWDSVVILGLGSQDCLVTAAQISSPGSPKRSRGFSRLRWTTR